MSETSTEAELPTENRPSEFVHPKGIALVIRSSLFDFGCGELALVAFDSSLKLALGEVVITPGAALALPADDITAAVQKHARGDWGELDFENRQLNDLRLQQGGPLASIYTASSGLKFYVLTEADRSVTTVLLPEEY